MSEPRPAKRALDDAGLFEAQSRPPRRWIIYPIASPEPEYHDRVTPEEAILDELPLSTPPIETLPQELLLEVFEHLVHHSLVTAGFPEQRATHRMDDFDLKDDQPNQNGLVTAVDRKDLRNLCLVSRKLMMAATTLLYRCAHFAMTKSSRTFLLTLRAHPELRPLVKHISVPTFGWRSTKRFSFAFFNGTHELQSLRRRASVDPEKNFFAECGEYLIVNRLMLTLSLVSNLRTLVIPQDILIDGPLTKDLVLPNLTKLRINLMAQNEVIFRLCDLRISDGTLTWLIPGFIGYRFPALQRLEISTPKSRWEADLVSEEVDSVEGGVPWKYVESLKTITTSPTVPAEWDLMSLEQPIFHPSKLRTLEFDGPGKDCSWVSRVPRFRNWDLNRFFGQKGGGLVTLSLDWEVHDYTEFDGLTNFALPHSYFGFERRLHALDKLTNLTHLTVSLQALFGVAGTFWDWLIDMEASPEEELAKLLPPSLQTLWIAEYIPGVYEEECNVWEFEDQEHRSIRYHGRCVCRFLQALRTWWLSRDEGRELWFRRYADLDQLEMDSGASLARSGIAFILNPMVERIGRFERVLRPQECDSSDDD